MARRNCVVIFFLIASLAKALTTSALAATSSGIDTPTGNHNLPLAVEGVAAMTLADGGSVPVGSVYVGIGTTSPTEPLEVAGVVQIHDVGVTPDNGYNGALRITRADASGQYINLVRSGQYGWSIGTVYNSNTFGIGVITAADSSFVPSFVILPGGYVGIGTTSPSEPLDVTGVVRASGEFIGTLASGDGQFRMIGGSYGAFFRNDGSNTYLLLTATGDQYGGWNGLRPLTVSDVSGVVSFGQGIDVTGGGITFPDGTVQTTAAASNYEFGGIYTELNGTSCYNKNAYTGACSCPSGFSSSTVLTGSTSPWNIYTTYCYKP